MQWVFWYWWILAAVLAAAEIFAPGAVLIWMAAAAVLVGGLLYLFPEMVFELQLLLWAVLSGVAVFAWRAWFKRYPQPTDEPALNRRGSAYVGRQLVLSQSIENGVGKVIFMPLEASGVIGAVGGVAEMLRSGAAPPQPVGMASEPPASPRPPADTVDRIAEDASSTPQPPEPGERSGR